MKTNKLIILMAVLLVLAIGVITASANPELSYWNGYYCTSGNCGANTYNYGYNTSNFCTVNYLAPFRAEFVRDVNYPDGTYVMPGSSFTKTWRIRNIGSQAWTTDMQLVYVAGDPMNAYNVYLPHYVAPGNTVDISVRLTAPTYGGTVSGQWMLQAPDGTLFGVGCYGTTPVWVSVKTWTNGACSCLGQPTCNCKGASARSGRNPYCNNKIRDIKDVTYPDGTVVAPGTTFRKTWRMKNGGTCVWDQNYVLSFFYGDDFGFDGEVSIYPAGYEVPNYNGTKYQPNRQKNFYIQPGEYVYVSVDLRAPMVPGNYEAYFKLRDNLGYEFGFGSYADAAFWVNINVANDGKGVAMGNRTPVNTTESKSPDTDVEIIQAVVMDETPANLCGDQSIALINSENGYKVHLSVANQGTSAWEGYTLEKSDSNPAITTADSSIMVPATDPGQTAEITFDVIIDNSIVTSDALWMKFNLNSGKESFCEFYFEAPAK